MNFVLPLRQRIPKGEYLEKFLKENNLWEEFRTSTTRRHHDSECLALEVFVKNRGLDKEFRKFRDARITAIRLGDRAVKV